jgi:hypothetical protein
VSYIATHKLTTYWPTSKAVTENKTNKPYKTYNKVKQQSDGQKTYNKDKRDRLLRESCLHAGAETAARNNKETKQQR